MRESAMRCIGVYGASGFGREVLPLVRAQHSAEQTKIVFIDDSSANGSDILSFQDFANLSYEKKSVTIAIANPYIREKLALQCRDSGIGFTQVSAFNSMILDNVEIGEGAILCGFTQLTSNIKIGNHFHANIYSYVAHDCIIGNFVTFAPGVHCNGNILIEDYAYIGTGAILKQGTPESPLRIGQGATVGMGAVVTKSVAAGETVIGNPARPIGQR